MTSIIEKRLSLHKKLRNQQQHNDALESQLNKLQPLANLGTTTCMIAHEINNLLTPLANYAALALNSPDDKTLVEKALRKTVQNCERASKFMESILAMTNGPNNEKKNVALIVLVEQIFNCLGRDFAKDRITVQIRMPEDLTIWAVPVQMQQVLMNLILNARDAMLENGGTLTITAAYSTDAAQIEVTDTGCGIAPAVLKNIFEPFFTTKGTKSSPSRRCGAGLGLAYCKKALDAHNGSIAVDSRPGCGTTFKITLPNQK